jgi:putative ABC transport system permease protein
VSWSRFFRRNKWDAERARELDAYLESETAENIARGMSPGVARDAARRKLGNLTQIREEIYHMNSLGFLETFLQDVRFAFRMLRKNPGFTAIAVLTLALGIGANTAIFSVINAVMLRPLPYKNPSRLVMVWSDHHLRGGPAHEWTNPADFYDWRAQSKSMEDMAVFAGWGPTLTGRTEPELLTGSRVSYSLFSVLGVAPEFGRDFTTEDDKPNGPRVVIISHDLWQREFHSDPAQIGRQINLDGNGYSVIGVMPAGFSSPIIANREIWTPLQAPSRGRGNAVIRAIGRLRPGSSLAQAQAEMDGIASRISQAYPQTNARIGVSLVPLQEQISGPVRTPLLVLLGAVCLVLLIGCSNVANLLLARAADRQREISVRIALGAKRSRLVRQLLTESCLLAFVGGAAGLLLAVWGMRALAAQLPPAIASVSHVGLDPVVLAFTLGIALFTGIVFGLVPAFQASRVHLNETLRLSGRGSTSGKGRHRLRNVLVVADVALALALSVGAGLLLKSFVRLSSVDLGFQADHLLTVNLFLPRTSYPNDPQIDNFYSQLEQKVGALPGVLGVTDVSDPPLAGGGSDTSIFIEGRPIPAPTDMPDIWYSSVTPSFFKTLGIPLIRGRVFDDRDIANKPAVVVINESMSRRYWPGEDPIGKRIGTGSPEKPDWSEIVGVVHDIKFFGLDKDQPPSMYAPLAELPQRGMTLMVRTVGPPLNLSSAVRQTVWAQDSNLAVPKFATMQDSVDLAAQQARVISTMTTLFALIALVLAAVGLYGVMAYIVTERTNEIGIRIALGASRSDVLNMILGGALRLGLIGVATGLVASYFLTHLLSGLLFGVQPTDPATFAAVGLLLIGVSLFASYIPARRAMRVDPMVALRYE